MGVTTVLLGQDGGSPSLPDARRAADSLPAWMDAVANADPDVNVATLSGHGALRRRAGIDDGTRKPSDAQLERLQSILDRDLRAGAFGMSTGLEYETERHSDLPKRRSPGPAIQHHHGADSAQRRDGQKRSKQAD